MTLLNSISIHMYNMVFYTQKALYKWVLGRVIHEPISKQKNDSF